MVSQLVTIGAVLLGATATYFATYLLTRQRNQYELATRWDGKKLDAYENYVDKVRASVSAALVLYEGYRRQELRAEALPEQELRAALSEAVRVRSRAFERVMLLGGEDVVETAHDLNATAEGLIWRARGEVAGSHDDWLTDFRAVFQSINAFHDAARKDLGVRGSVTGGGRPERDVLLPPPPQPELS
ncbi:hypothetical protein [Nocardia sp. NPDC056100]|uniref:hypothetical protein n=1 Tax=Nocardia sp. NPDC056100 TaxID=3345712 RepID=UPI0035DDB339